MGFRLEQVLIVLMSAAFATANLSSAMGDPGASTPSAPKKIYYADPVKGSTATGLGTKTRPWGTLESIVDAKLIDGSDLDKGKVHAGDVIYLMNGNHGSVSLWGPAYQNTSFITLQAAPGQKPVINELTITNCSRWVVRGLTFETPAVVTQRKPLLLAQNSSELIIDANKFRSQADVSKWTAEDWADSSATYGIFTNKIVNSTISKNSVSNVENGIVISGEFIEAVNNSVDYFANDGIQFTASNSVVSRNRVTNHYGRWNNGYHHDGMQGWTAHDEDFTVNVVLDSNVVMASTGIYPTIPAVPTGVGDDYMQGITIFDGDWSNLSVTNNVVAAAGYHGMALYHQKNASVLNNTVVQQAPTLGSWLGIFGNSQNVIVRNNISSSYAFPQTGVVFDSNLSLSTSWQSWQKTIPVVTNPAAVFAKWSPKTAEFDFRLAPKSYAIGRGSTRSFAKRDIVYVNRNPAKIDMGAYVYVPK